jgi:branched-chain amino acid transport system substrate-binding protein
MTATSQIETPLQKSANKRSKEDTMHSHPRWIARVCVIGAAAIVAALALGHSGGAATSAAAKPKCGLGNGKAAHGNPINVGADVTASGGLDFSSAAKAATAYFKCVNANGGISGRPIHYLVEDDGLDPAKASAAAAKLVDDEKVVALVGSTSQVDCGVNAAFYAKRNVLVIAGVGVPKECFNSANIAPVNAGPRLGAVASAQWAHSHFGAKKFVVLAYGIPSLGDWVADGVSAYAQTIGGSSTKILFAPGLQDAQSVVLQATASNPDAIILGAAVQDDVALLQAAEAQGLGSKFHWVCLTPCYDLSFPKAAGSYWNGIPADSEFQMLNANTPDNQLWRHVMNAYGRSTDPRDSFSQAGFLAAKIFTDTVLKLKPATINRVTVTKAIKAIRDYKSDMTCGPYYFGNLGIHNANHATRFVRLNGSGFSLDTGCFQIKDPALAPILQDEKTHGLTK